LPHGNETRTVEADDLDHLQDWRQADRLADERKAIQKAVEEFSKRQRSYRRSGDN
jgi:hypothetical protein